MSNIIFARTRWHYESYTDYWELVKLSKFQTCYVDEIDLNNDAVYIVSPMNGEIYDRFPTGVDGGYSNSKLILWNLERPGSGSLTKFAIDNFELRKYFHKVILSDVVLANQCANITHSNFFQYVTLGLHQDLGYPGTYANKLYDYIHLSCYSPNRSWLFDTPSSPKLDIAGCSIANNSWGDERHIKLQRSRYMLNVHQDDWHFIEPLRFVLAAAYGLPIVSERCENCYPYNLLTFNTISDIKRYAKQYDSDMYDYGILNRDHMLKYPFRECVERFVDSL